MRNFIVYSPDSPEHTEDVRQLAKDLAEAGIECDVDLLAKTPAEGWRSWTDGRARAADVVLLVISPVFARRIQAAIAGEKGARHDARLAAQLLGQQEQRTLFVIVPDAVDPASVPPSAEAAPRFRYPSGLDDLRAALAGRVSGTNTIPSASAHTPQSPQSPPREQRVSSEPRTPDALSLSESPKTRLSGPPSPKAKFSRTAAVQDYLRTLISVYERSGALGVFVRPSGDAEGAADLVAHAKETLIRDPSAIITLLGNYGSGKSYAATRLAYELAKDVLAGRTDVPVPFYLNLSFARGQASLPKAISLFAARYNVRLSERELLEILDAGPHTALVLDGLDEMGERIKREETPKFAAALAELRKKPGLRVFLTCRTTFYNDCVDDDQIPATRKITLLPFDDQQIETYIARAPDPVRTRLVEMLERIPRLRELCRTPIHLLLSQEYVAERSELAFGDDGVQRPSSSSDSPGRPAFGSAGSGGSDFRLIDLYDAFVRKNLAVHATTNPGWSPRARRDFVRRLAYHMFDEGLIEMTTDELLRVLSDELPDASPGELAEMATQIKNCSFFVRAGGTFRPLHLSFLEYFVAEALVEELYEGNIVKWNKRPLYAEVFDFMIQMVQRHGIERLPFEAIVGSEKEEAPANFLATMYRWPVPEVRSYFEKLLLEGKWGMVRSTACMGVGVYDSAVVPCLFEAFDREKNTILRAVIQRLLERLRDEPGSAPLRDGIDARLAMALTLSPDDAHEVLRTKKEKFSLQAYRKALMLGDRRPSSTIAAMYLLAGVNDTESYPDIEKIARASRLPAVHTAYEHARSLADLPPLSFRPPPTP